MGVYGIGNKTIKYGLNCSCFCRMYDIYVAILTKGGVRVFYCWIIS